MFRRVRGGSERAHRSVALAHADDAGVAVGRSDLCAAATRTDPHVRTHGRMHAGGFRTALEASLDSLRDGVGRYRVQPPEPSRCEKAVHALAASHALAHAPARPCTRTGYGDTAITAAAREPLRSAAQRSGHCALDGPRTARAGILGVLTGYSEYSRRDWARTGRATHCAGWDTRSTHRGYSEYSRRDRATAHWTGHPLRALNRPSCSRYGCSVATA
jgi:hypothetical protein